MMFWNAAQIGRRDDPKAPRVASMRREPRLLNNETAGYRPELLLRSLLDTAASGGRLSLL
jgi:hypothetical protein